MAGRNQRQIYVILSVDAEHDIITSYDTGSAGWTKGTPLLFSAFDEAGVKGKVCWLVEYNIKDGIVAANPDSPFYCPEFPELIGQIKGRGDEIGMHPTVYDWLGGGGRIPASSYRDPVLWDMTRRYHDPEFVTDLITSATNEVRKVCEAEPAGCRTCGCGWYATHLISALQKNGIHTDSSVPRALPWQGIKTHNVYYPAEDDMRNGKTDSDMVEIPITGNICAGWQNRVLTLRTRYLLQLKKPLFLSFYVHNWQAVTPEGTPDTAFLDNLSSFLRFLQNHGAQFVRWTEARELYKEYATQPAENIPVGNT